MFYYGVFPRFSSDVNVDSDFLQNSSTWNLGKHQLQEATEIMLEN